MKARRRTKRAPRSKDRRTAAEQPTERNEKKENRSAAGPTETKEPKVSQAEAKKTQPRSRRRAKLGKAGAGSAGAAPPKALQALMWFEIKIFIADFALKEAGCFTRFR